MVHVFAPVVLALAAANPRVSSLPIVEALHLLGQSAPTAPITLIHPRAEKGFAGARTDAAYTDGRTIWLNAYLTDPRKIAAILAHEQWHILHGPAEPPAYAEQARVLRNFGLDKEAHRIEKVAQVVTRRSTTPLER